jgi:hypothetical protein
MIGAFIVGVAMAKIVELPTLRLRDRLFPSRLDGAVKVDIQPIAVPVAPEEGSPRKIWDRKRAA